MDTSLKVIGGIAAATALVFLVCLLGVLGGIFGGWVVGLFFTDLIIGTLSRINGINTVGLEVWQIGGFLGFVGAFFKSYLTNTK